MWILQSTEQTAETPLTLRLPAGTARTVGRAPVADFVVEAALLSRLHCRLTAVSDDVLQVEDLSSTNGTFVNGERIAAARLSPGDTLRLGRLALKVSKKTD